METLRLALTHVFLGYFTASYWERFWHKNLWHTPMPGVNFFASWWGYDLTTHKIHHQVMKGNSMADPILTTDEYVVQTPSNVFLAAVIAAVSHYSAAMVLTGGHTTLNQVHLIASIATTVFYFLVWYLLEDHFHTGHHFPEYREKYLSDSGLVSRWFQYTWRYHKVHHDEPRMNYNFIFPLADWVFGTYISPWVWEKYQCECHSKKKRSHSQVKSNEKRTAGRQLWELVRDYYYPAWSASGNTVH